jgi:transcriptional regulator GlxA family with amidase domain
MAIEVALNPSDLRFSLNSVDRSHQKMKPTHKLAYTTTEVAELMGFSRRTIVRLFEHEKGVLILERKARTNKRRYRSMRIPRTVLERVQQRLAGPMIFAARIEGVKPQRGAATTAL